MNKEKLSRRHFIKSTIYSGTALLGGGVLINACGNSSDEQEESTAGDDSLALNGSREHVDQCEDFSGVSEAELAKRSQFGYVEETSDPESKCSNCQLWIMPKENQNCGGCMLFEGPVYDDAYCTYWAPQV